MEGIDINEKWLLCATIINQDMKKWIVWLLVILFLTVGCIYLLIPAKIVISSISTAQATVTGEFRYLGQEENWEKWWRDADGKSRIKGEPFIYDGTLFHLNQQFHNIVGIDIERSGLKLQSVLHLISFKKDSTGAVWQCEIPTGNNPLTRIMKYRSASKIKRSMKEILGNLTTYVSDPKNVYGLSIHRTSTRDTTMLTASFVSPAYPTTPEIYSYFGILENSIQKQHGEKTGSPMMNVKELENGKYETQVAIPTNRLLQNDGKIQYRRMVPGNFIVSEVKGGPVTIDEAITQLDYYIADYKKTVMAKPFQVLVTDRLTETDTTKWVTKIFVPVME
jgi:effector-binding domain-containing protein